LTVQIVLLVVVIIVLAVVARSLRVAAEWQRAVILRLGRFHKTKGPGVYLVFPAIDRVAQIVDLRIQTTTITAEQALTRDTVAVGVDAIVFWQVDNAEAAAIHIADYSQAIERVAQTSLREMIGATELSRLLSDRKTADEQLRQTISEKTTSWGVVARSVEIKDVSIPRELQDAMSRQAQAEREKDARVTLASAEREIAQQILLAAALYGQDPNALKLRQMNLLYEMNKERGTTVLIPKWRAAWADWLASRRHLPILRRTNRVSEARVALHAAKGRISGESSSASPWAIEASMACSTRC
jgi:regulator of protease activity HflC (stomatin/prohibitin superfamily)